MDRTTAPPRRFRLESPAAKGYVCVGTPPNGGRSRPGFTRTTRAYSHA